MSARVGNINNSESPGVRWCDKLYCNILDRDTRMNEDTHTERHYREKERLMELWPGNSGRFTVFAPERLPVPDIWEAQVSEIDRDCRTNLQYIKRWKFRERTTARESVRKSIDGKTPSAPQGL